MRHPARWLAALALLAGTGLAACGDDDDVETDPAQTDAGPDEEMTDDDMSDEEMTDDDMSDEEMTDDDMSDEG